MAENHLSQSTDLINKILKEAVSFIPEEGWQSAKLSMGFKEDAIELTCTFTKNGQEKEFFIGSSLMDSVQEFWRVNRNKVGSGFKEASFEVSPGGKILKFNKIIKR